MLSAINLSIENLPLMVIIMVLFILFASIYVSFKVHPDQYPKTRVSVFFSSLASIAILLVGINVVMTSLSFEYSQKYLRVQQTKTAVDKLWLLPNKLIAESRHIRLKFLAGFYPNNSELNKMVLAQKDEPQQTVESIVEEQYVAIVLIQAWEDFLEQKNFDNTSLRSWLVSFLTWAQNPYFKYYYDSLAFQWQTATMEFGDLLFEYAKTIPYPATDTRIYRETATQMLKDPRVIRLLKL